MKLIREIPASFVCPLCREPVSDVTSHVRGQCPAKKKTFVADLIRGDNGDTATLYQDQDGDLWLLEGAVNYDDYDYSFKPYQKKHVESLVKQYESEISFKRDEITAMIKHKNKLERLSQL